MNVRIATGEDRQVVEDLHSTFYGDEFPFPSMTKTIQAMVVEDNGQVQGFGVVKEISECIMVLDKSQGKLQRARLVDTLLPHAFTVAQEAGHDGVHAFVQDEYFARFLKRKFGFGNAKGQVLVRGI
jgi:hypothetical protein|tara:strand:- start:2944 stop:3321 length:378 start_codon:yes stop_codon:yes gene_type:complete